MNRAPRLLPLIAIAVGGVLAINLIAGASGLPQALQGARAWAEDLVEDAELAAPAAKTVAGPLPDPKAPAPAAPVPGVCVPTVDELAEDAGMSPNELLALQRLGERRAELEAREGDFDTQIQLLTAAEGKLDSRIAVLRGMIEQLQRLLGQVDERQKTENARLVKVYETMRARDAANALEGMADDVRLPILAEMKEAKLAAILNEMSKRNPQVAREVTEKLARRTAEAFALNDVRAATTPAAQAPPAAPEPAQQASAAPPQPKAPAPAAKASPPRPKAASPQPAPPPPAANRAPAEGASQPQATAPPQASEAETEPAQPSATG